MYHKLYGGVRTAGSTLQVLDNSLAKLQDEGSLQVTSFTQGGLNTIALPSGAISVTLECERGHQEEGSMTVLLDTQTGNYTCYSGSSWHHCGSCELECDIGDSDDCFKPDCPHGWRSDESREAGHKLIMEQVDQWWAKNSHLIGGSQGVD